jgi:hypothetical protein
LGRCKDGLNRERNERHQEAHRNGENDDILAANWGIFDQKWLKNGSKGAKIDTFLLLFS